MSPKSPPKRIVTAEIHHPHEPPSQPVPRPFVPPDAVPRRPGHASGRTMAGTDLEAITPAPSVVISQIPSADHGAPTSPLKLEHYRVDEQISLPLPDAEGFRTFKDRRYVDVPDGGIVHVVADPQTGLYRAKLPSERIASGPALLRDPDDLLWHPLEAFEPSTFPLSAARLQTFASDLDFTGVKPGQDHLYRYDNKLYVVIENRAYQVLHDVEASSPARTVMRIIHSDSSRADDSGNDYVAGHPGRSEPVVFDVDGWVGTLVGGAGGGRRRTDRNDASLSPNLALEILDLDLQFKNASAIGDRLQNLWPKVKGTVHERNLLERLEAQHQQELEILQRSFDLHTGQKKELVAATGRDIYQKKIIALQKRRMLAYSELIVASDSRKLLDNPRIFEGPPAEYASVVAHLDNKLVILKKRQDIADELVSKWRVEPSELKEASHDPIEMHQNIAFWVFAKSRMFIDAQATVDVNNIRAKYLASCFADVTWAFRDIDSIPVDTRIPVLSDLLDEASIIRASFEKLQLPPDPQHAHSCQEITQAIQRFENTLEQHLHHYHLAQEETSALPPHLQPIDFDFIPTQGQNQSVSASRKMFRSKHNGVYKIRVGRPRRTDAGEELIDVLNPLDPTEVLQTFERRDGEWRRQVARQRRNLATLINQADQLLTHSRSRLNSALYDERHRRNANSIVESLTEHTDDLDELARQIEGSPNPANRDIAPLLQRLNQDRQRLLREGEQIRVRLYKDPAWLSVDRVSYLISHDHLDASRIQTRVQLGKGNEKDFLDVYALNDRLTGITLWYAHFHYPAKDTPGLEFIQRRGHLKTREQNRLGTSSQRRDELAGRPHVRIWREDIDLSTAQRIFQLASPNHAPQNQGE
ncbi:MULTISPECIES: hypothetical protein [unclassified Pseudomonas]|uniref:hypothetical protein n=1 Tax=unclassified Pseudomonas TaxID=196821 RepID=UPI0028933FE3|nr:MULTISPECIES: hypothetical protein [unclassified Pseudomonas]